MNLSTSMKYVLLALCFSFSQISFAQNLLVNNSGGNLINLDINGCGTSTVFNIGSYTDIASHPDGFLYGVNIAGQIYRIDLTNGNAIFVNAFPFSSCFALTSDIDGNIFGASGSGDLSSYDPSTNQITNYPNMGYGASGDLTFYQGVMYMATTDNTMVSVYPNSPQNNDVFIDFSSANATIFGIVSNVEGCKVKTYALSNDNFAKVYEIDWINQTFNYICDIPHRVYGGSSEFEFDASIETIEVSDVIIDNNGCDVPDNLVTVIASSDNGDLVYSLDGVNFQQNNSFQDLAFGDHTIFMEDINGCEGSVDLTIDAASLSINDVISSASGCTVPNTYVEVIASASNGILNYSIDNINYQSSNIFTNLPFGTYTIYVNDGQNCSAETSVTLNPTAISIDEVISFSSGCDIPSTYVEIIATTENSNLMYSADGINFQSENIFNNLVFGDYTITVQDDSGCQATTTVSLNPGSITINEVISDAAGCLEPETYIEISATSSSGGLTYSADGINFQIENIFENLEFGNQTIYIEDAAGCQTDTSIFLASGFLNITNLETTPASCNEENGSLIVEVNSNTTELAYSINGSTFQSENTFTNIAPGNYQVLIKDSTNCEAVADFTIDDNQSFELLSVDATNTSCNQSNGSITVAVLENGNVISYGLDTINFVDTNTFQNLPNGNYTIYVRDTNNCLISLEQSIISDDNECEIYVPNVFSPNFDGHNDLFRAFSRLDLLVLEMRIFNRWGAEVFAAENFSTFDQTAGWNGMFKGRPASTGVYVYYIKIKGDQQDILLKGDVSIIK